MSVRLSCALRPGVRFTRRSGLWRFGERYRVAVGIGDLHVADTVRVSLDWLMFDTFGGQALQKRVESGNGEGDPARARPRRVRLNEQGGVLVDVPQDLFACAQVRRPPEEPCVPIDRDIQPGYRDTRDEVGDCALHAAPRWSAQAGTVAHRPPGR